MTGIEDANVLGAAMTIRGELTELAPADATMLRVALDRHISRAEAASGSERSAIVDEIIDVLNSSEPSRKRFRQLLPDVDTYRGVLESAWAPDWVTAGKVPDDEQEELTELTCQTCGFANKLAFRPPEDDPVTCQNPKPPSHPLKLA